ncbi:MAG: hypothetical protein PHT54_03890 [Candidatus Nanoarchaeia archaeon]|nr:hypothetical protein [Candidatus Nanoarchaeia archaeon]
MSELPPLTKEQKLIFGVDLINLIRQRNTIASISQKEKLEKKITKAREDMRNALKKEGLL